MYHDAISLFGRAVKEGLHSIAVAIVIASERSETLQHKLEMLHAALPPKR